MCGRELAGTVVLAALAGGLAGCLQPPPGAERADGSPVADPDAAITTPDAGTLELELLQDGWFDADSGAWTLSGQARIGTAAEIGLLAVDTDPNAMQLGRLNDDDDSFQQLVDIPLGTTAVRITGVLCFTTQEPGTSPAADLVAMTLEVLAQEPITLATWSNLDAGATCDWTAFEIDPDEDLGGHQAVFKVEATTDSVNPTGFWFDSISFVAVLADQS